MFMMARLKAIIQGIVLRYLKPYFSDLYQYDSNVTVAKDVEDFFKTSDGRSILVSKHHRYSLKPAWMMFGPMNALNELDKKGLLNGNDRQFLENVKGYRTITSSLSEIRNVLKPYLENYADLFLNANIPNLGIRVLKPTKEEVEACIAKKVQMHKKRFEKIKKIVSFVKQENIKVLEVGYTSGGESIIGFERVGMQAYGLDYSYNNVLETHNRHVQVARLANSKVKFLTGDITKKTSIEDNFLDFIYTQSVLEHIQNLPDAFAEMYRILKPGV